jgi:hypothetical protein
MTEVPHSPALAFNLVNNNVSLWRDEAGGTPPLHDLGQSRIALNSGRPLRVVINYSHADRTLLLTITDLNEPENTTGPPAMNNVDIPGFLEPGNAAMARIGFTAGTDAKSAEQRILDCSVP